MIQKLEQILERYQFLEHTLALPERISDGEEYSKLLKEYSSMTELVGNIREYRCINQRINEAKEILATETDSDLRLLAEEELYSIQSKQTGLEDEIKRMLLPKDPRDDKNVILEIRAGAGGEEAALFASVLYRMYVMFAEAHGFRCELANCNATELGGYREITCLISGSGAYSRFKYESGVHRVQRVPETESSGRIHTSTATVAVLVEEEDVKIEIDPSDLQFDTMKSTGAGGQHINKTESAIRLTHKPSGIVIECQEERSQLRNKEKALRLLKAKLQNLKESEQKNDIDFSRRQQVGSGDRSERVRTYNYPQGRVTDHRIGMTLYSLESFLNGDIEEIINALASAEISEKLKNNGLAL